MALALGELVQDVDGSRREAFGRVCGDAQILGDAVRALEAHAVNLRRQAVGVFAENPYGGFTVGSENFLGQMKRDVVLTQEEHDLLDLALALPALDDRLEFLRAQSVDFREALGLVVENFEGFLPKTRHDTPGESGADVLHDAGSQVFFDSLDSRRLQRAGEFGVELAAEPGVILPGALEPDALALADGGEITHHGHARKILVVRLDEQDAVAGVLRAEAYAFHRAGQLGSVFGEKARLGRRGPSSGAMRSGFSRHESILVAAGRAGRCVTGCAWPGVVRESG